MTDALADLADKVDDADKGADVDKDNQQDALKSADAAKAEADKKAADEAAKGKDVDKDKPKEFVADSTKTDEENDAARAEFDKANGAADKDKEDKKGLPDDWREQMAGKDDAALKLAKRYGSPAGVLKALKEAQDTIRSGKMKSVMPDAKDEKAMAEWRKAEGIPDDATGYKLPEAVQKRLVDEDKPILSSFTDFAHAKNARPDVVEIASEWYVEMAEAAEAKKTEDDKAAGEACEDSLRKEWAHSEYKGNVKLAHRWVETIPGLGTDFAVARLPDGRRLVDNPEFIAWAADMGRDKFGDLAFTTSDGERQHNNRKAELEKLMNTDIDEYYRSGADKELAKILEKEERRAK